MGGSYAAIWSDNDRPTHLGRVELTDGALELDDGAGRRKPPRRIRLDRIASVRMASPSERLGDLKTVVVQLDADRGLRIGVLGLGAALELGALLAEQLPPARAAL
jgi:hypothetical protein